MRILTVGLIGLLLMALGACSSAAPADSTGAEASDDAAASVGPGVSQEPAASAPDDGDGGSLGGDGAAYCLNTVEEVSEALEVEVATADGVANPGLGGGCMYSTADGAPVYTISVLDSDAAADAFEGYREYDGAEEVGGIGDVALYLPMGETFGIAFKKGDVVASGGVTSTMVTLSGDALRAAVEELARQAAEGL